eukprot:1764605-Pleurochrysis_carterae.AAC.5
MMQVDVSPLQVKERRQQRAQRAAHGLYAAKSMLGVLSPPRRQGDAWLLSQHARENAGGVVMYIFLDWVEAVCPKSAW